MEKEGGGLELVLNSGQLYSNPPSKLAIEKGILAKVVSRGHQQKQKASNVKMLHYEECDQLAHLSENNALECTRDIATGEKKTDKSCDICHLPRMAVIVSLGIYVIVTFNTHITWGWGWNPTPRPQAATCNKLNINDGSINYGTGCCSQKRDMNTPHAADFVLETLLNPAGQTSSAWAPPLLDNGKIQTPQTKPRTLTQPTEQNDHLLIIYKATLEFGKHNN